MKIKQLFKALFFQFKKKGWFRNFFITRNAWGLFSINSHINQHNNKPKQMYNTLPTAIKSAAAMEKKTGKHFSVYKCAYCTGYHIGKNRENK